MVGENQSQETSPISPSEQSDSSCFNVDAKASTGIQLKDTDFYDIDHTPKVRKPYTITKQREKWTEEEHQKFLEALKLYGRAWRQIEEHVGTKTAVQIRSHAQKFFSKVTREGNGSNEGSSEPIDIPPPRPKRKPMHPYPRKFVDFHLKTSFPSQDEQGACSNLLVTPQRTESPTSVLSAAASPTLESPVSEQKSLSLLPSSCKTGLNLIKLSPVKKLDKGIRNGSPEREDKSFMLQAEMSASSAVDNPSMNQSQGISPISSSERSDSSRFNVDVKASTGVQLKDTNFYDIDHTPKVRKPYTIKKQKEKWTEEEHQRFLEALKLYGRAWHQIEEHVGTKTAIQIRSHAQKFFSKVTRVGNGSNEGSSEPIEIPPPRPKRKPIRPYPRKCVDFHLKTSFPSQDEQRACSNLLATTRQTESPTLLSAAASPALESPVSGQKSLSLSPSSFKTGLNLIKSSPVKKLDKGKRNSSPEREDKSFMLQAVSASSAVDNPSMKLDLEFKDTESTKWDATVDAPSTIIRLIGQTVLVIDTDKPAPSAAENQMTPVSFTGIGNTSIPNPVHPLSQLNTQILLGMSHYNWEPWSHRAAEFDSGESLNNDPNSTVVVPGSTPWLAVYPSLLAPYPYSQSCIEERLKEKDISCTGSNNGSTGEVENGEKNSDAADSQSPAEKSTSSLKQSKGFVPYKRRSMEKHAFVPYKRCLVEGRDASSSATQEREGQGDRVCL